MRIKKKEHTPSVYNKICLIFIISLANVVVQDNLLTLLVRFNSHLVIPSLVSPNPTPNFFFLNKLLLHYTKYLNFIVSLTNSLVFVIVFNSTIC